MVNFISVKGAKEHNLRNINIELPKEKLVVITGVSGSGKSSLAFDTIYAEGQRRYVESLSTYARQFLEMQSKPDVELIEGLSPVIAIDQKSTSRNPRSTVATCTEIYDYLRVLFARIGIPYSPATNLPIAKQSASQMLESILKLPKSTKAYILAPVIRGQKGEHRKELLAIRKHGYERLKIDGILYEFDDLPRLDKNKKHDIEIIIDRVLIDKNAEERLADSIESALELSDGILYVEIVNLPKESGAKYKPGEILVFSSNFACPVSGFSIPEIEPRIFSFNSPYGACPACNGLGSELDFDENLLVPNPKLSLSEGAIAVFRKTTSRYSLTQNKFYEQTFKALAKHYDFSLLQPFDSIPKEIQEIIFYGSKDVNIKFYYENNLNTTEINKPFEGVIPLLEKRIKKTESTSVIDELSRYQVYKNCRVCSGYRLKEESLCIKIDQKHVGEICRMTVAQAFNWAKNVSERLTEFQRNVAKRVLKEIERRLSFLNNVGLGYLTLNRKSSTLSGGEAQRIRLASQIGSGLSGVLYVLDEPSIGLHQSDNQKLLDTLKELRDIGNTVIVVEHDEETMKQSDYLVDMGPGAGIHGGSIIAQGIPEEVIKNKSSITGGYLSGKYNIKVPRKRKYINEKKFITVTGAKANNLKNISVDIPLGTFVTVTGVSGSGKSTFIIQTLYRSIMKKLHNSNILPGEYESIKGLEFIDKVIQINQQPIGRTPRSNPATYTGVFTPIRDWFVNLKEAKIRGYSAGRFSFNVKGGRCETCEGDGLIKIEMHFLPDVYVRCDECHGTRYNKETLQVKYKHKSIADVLDMTVEDAVRFFDQIPIIQDKLKALEEVGLGYMELGQSATTLSGGEAQRVKLAKELSKKSTGRTLYILDEPTTGLHFHDINKLLKVLHKLVDSGNTVIVIEHNLDVIKTADYVIDVGPSGGDKGGNIVAAGTPEEVAQNDDSITGQYLKSKL